MHSTAYSNGEYSTEICLYQDKNLTTDMPSYCRFCPLYLNTCLPVIMGGYLCGSECADLIYCDYCEFFNYCGK